MDTKAADIRAGGARAGDSHKVDTRAAVQDPIQTHAMGARR